MHIKTPGLVDVVVLLRYQSSMKVLTTQKETMTRELLSEAIIAEKVLTLTNLLRVKPLIPSYLYSFHLTKKKTYFFLVQIFILEDFKAKVISDYHHSRKVSVKQKSRNSRYRLDNRNRGDHDDRDDDDGHGRRAGAKDISKRIGNRLVILFSSEPMGFSETRERKNTGQMVE